MTVLTQFSYISVRNWRMASSVWGEVGLAAIEDAARDVDVEVEEGTVPIADDDDDVRLAVEACVDADRRLDAPALVDDVAIWGG
jgi:hypothetical protein